MAATIPNLFAQNWRYDGYARIMMRERMMVATAWIVHVAATRMAVRKPGSSPEGFVDEAGAGTGK